MKVDDAKFGIKLTKLRPTDEERKACKKFNDVLFDFSTVEEPKIWSSKLAKTTFFEPGACPRSVHVQQYRVQEHINHRNMCR